MNKFRLLGLFFIASTVCVANATEHHSGHGGMTGSGGGGVGACSKPQLEKFSPKNMETVAPESEFSFRVFYIENPEQIEVTVKTIPTGISSEFKDPFYVIKGNLPKGLKNTFARINVKVKGETKHCEAESGWLVKISE